MASPSSSSPGLGKKPPLSCQHRPLGRCADVCVLLHVGVRASPGLVLLPPKKPVMFSAGRPLLFLSLCVPVLTSSLSPSISKCIQDGSKLSVQL